MPAPGDQHAIMANPFEEQRPRISAYTAQEIATLQSKLEKQLGPEYLSARKGAGNQTMHYVTADKCITLANEIFGFNGWSSSIQNLQVDYVDEEPGTNKVSIGLHVIVRVTLRDGTYHEDIGYGHIENARGKAGAFEKAKKEGTTDALKRALRQFGNVLGNCIYDKAYLAKATKMKVVQPKFNEEALHRHPDFVQKKTIATSTTSTTMESKPAVEGTAAPQARPQPPPPPPPPQLTSVESFEDFDLEDADDFDISLDHPDFVILPNSNEKDPNESILSDKGNGQQNGGINPVPQPPARPLARASSAGNAPRPAPQTPVQVPSRPITSTNHFPGAGGQNRGPAAANQPAHQPNPTGAAAGAPPTGNEPVTFFSARTFKGLPAHQSVGSLGEGNLAVPKPGQAFNPHLESPSIPRTPGVDHSASKPLSRSGVHVTGPPVGWKGGAGAGAGEGKEGAARGVVGGAAAGGGQQPPPAPQQGPGGAGMGAPRPVGAPPAARMGGNNAGGANPLLDNTRRIGAPGGAGSPLGNRGQFRPLTVKRPVGAGEGIVGGGGGGGGAGVVVGRTPLGDVTSNGVIGAGGVGGPDLKRQRTS